MCACVITFCVCVCDQDCKTIPWATSFEHLQWNVYIVIWVSLSCWLRRLPFFFFFLSFQFCGGTTLSVVRAQNGLGAPALPFLVLPQSTSVWTWRKSDMFAPTVRNHSSFAMTIWGIWTRSILTGALTCANFAASPFHTASLWDGIHWCCMKCVIFLLPKKVTTWFH